MTRPILQRKKTQQQIQQDREVAFDAIGWELLDKINSTYFNIRHKSCGKVKRYAIASLINTGLKPKCGQCLDKARKLALVSIGYSLGERVDSAKFNITHVTCGNTFPYRISNVKALGMTPRCPKCVNKDAGEK